MLFAVCCLLWNPPVEIGPVAAAVRGRLPELVDRAALRAGPNALARVDKRPLLAGAERLAGRTDLAPADRRRAAALRVNVLRGCDRDAEALAACDAAIAEFGPTPRLLTERLMCFYYTRDMPALAAAYDRIAAEVPEGRREDVAMAMVAAWLGRLDEAEAYARRAAGRDPRNEFAWSTLAKLLLHRDDYAGALDALDRSLALRRDWMTEDPSERHRDRAICLLELRRPAEAAVAAGRACALAPDVAANHRAVFIASKAGRGGPGNVAAQLRAAERLRRLEPDAPQTFAISSQAYENDGDFRRALPYARRYAEAVPGDPAGHFQIADLAARTDNFEEAVVAADQFLESAPANPRALSLKFQCLVRLRLDPDGVNPPGAVADVLPVADQLRAVAPNPKASVAAKLAVVYAVGERYEDALAMVDRGLLACETGNGRPDDRRNLERLSERLLDAMTPRTASAEAE